MGRGRDASFTVLGGILLLLVCLAAIFALMLVHRPTGSARPQLGQLGSLPCPTGTHVPVCYQATITNVGDAGGITCQVFPADGTTATFGNLLTTYTTPPDTPIQPNDSFNLVVLSKPLKGTKTVADPPSVACASTG